MNRFSQEDRIKNKNIRIGKMKKKIKENNMDWFLKKQDKNHINQE